MNESFPTPESLPISREEVIEAFKKFSEAGVGDPADLDDSDPEAVKAQELYDRWSAQGDKKDVQDSEIWHRHNFDKTMINIDAGFTDRNYLEDALDWLMQDAQDVEKILDDSEREETRDLLATAVKKIRTLLVKAN